MEYNISYKEENIPVSLSGSIVRLPDKIISQIIMDHYRTEGRGGGVEATTDMF